MPVPPDWGSVDVTAVPSSSTFVYVDGGADQGTSMQAFLTNNHAALDARGTNGGHLFLNSAGWENTITTGFGDIQLEYDGTESGAGSAIAGSPVWAGPHSPLLQGPPRAGFFRVRGPNSALSPSRPRKMAGNPVAIPVCWSRMKVTTCDLAGLLLIEPAVFGDHRGFFTESWSRERYRAAGVDCDFVQDNFSFSRRGTLRGMHFQNPTAQGKLVSVWQGEVWDVAVDLRRASPTFGRWHGVALSAENKHQFFVPPGFAHGFVVLSDTALFHYKCTASYAKDHERGFRWNDPQVGIRWPIDDPILSPRDAAAPLLRELPTELLF